MRVKCQPSHIKYLRKEAHAGMVKEIVYLYLVFITKGGRRGHDRMVVGFTTLWDKACQLIATCQWFSPGTPVSPTNKTDHNDITEILLKVALNTIHQPTNQPTIKKALQSVYEIEIGLWII